MEIFRSSWADESFFNCLVHPTLIQGFVHLFQCANSERIGQFIGLSVVVCIDPVVVMARSARPRKGSSFANDKVEALLDLTLDLSFNMVSYLDKERKCDLILIANTF